MSDDIFDPEIHATDKDGNPSTNKDGSFRKKRRDSGAGRTGGARKPSATKAKTPANDRERYAKAVGDFLAIPVMIASFVDPVDGYCAAELSPVLADAIGGLAVENPAVAAVCERLSVGGAVGTVAAVFLMAGVQFAHNHGKVPEHLAKMAGAKPRSEIERVLRARGEQLAAQRPSEAPADGEGVREHAAA